MITYEPGTIQSIRSPDANFNKDAFCHSSPSSEKPSTAWLSQRKVVIGGRPMMTTNEAYGSCPTMSSSLSSGSSESGGFTVPAMDNFYGYDYGGGGGGGTVATEEASPPPYPFSLLGGPSGTPGPKEKIPTPETKEKRGPNDGQKSISSFICLGYGLAQSDAHAPTCHGLNWKVRCSDPVASTSILMVVDCENGRQPWLI
ncbi:hypothetical protein HAX54_042472 [Datura stramonium]|uniref:Uncharacterized protein n=1 Tax=Datura stramonium TaxID=4076 RepID=A0ABS8SMH6_DATST|nr:hypothetical protein [Datura stramonium]